MAIEDRLVTAACDLVFMGGGGIGVWLAFSNHAGDEGSCACAMFLSYLPLLQPLWRVVFLLFDW